MMTEEEAKSIAFAVCKVSQLYSKALERLNKGRLLSGLKVLKEALDLARGLPYAPDGDCLVVARLEVMLADVLVTLLGDQCLKTQDQLDGSVAQWTSDATAYHVAACETLERRFSAGTLGLGRCAPHEVAFEILLLGTGVLRDGTVRETPEKFSRDVIVGTMHPAEHGAHLGYLTYVIAGYHAPGLTVLLAQLGETLEVDSDAIFRHTAELVMQRHAGRILPDVFRDEVKLLKAARHWLNILDDPGEPGETAKQMLALQEAQRLVTSRAGRRILAEADATMEETAEWQRKFHESVAARAAAHDLRCCALVTCGAREVEPLQYSKCGACKSVVYCCKEHQVADWPVHKHACKAARKAAAEDAS